LSLLLVSHRLRLLRVPLPSLHQDRRFPSNRTLSDHGARQPSRKIPIAPRRQPHMARAALKHLVSLARIREISSPVQGGLAVYMTFPPSRSVRISLFSF
jgi:hypothetical protein